MSIDLMTADNAFREFLQGYDLKDDQIRLKTGHTMAVRNSCSDIAKGLGLNEEDTKLAILIGLLHDVGRFEQAKLYHSFNDLQTTDHAKLGVKMLFEDGMIRRFIADTSYDSIIYEAIANHNRYAIREGLDERTLLHAKIIRDADKLDNYRVKLEDKVETMTGFSAEEVGATPLTDSVYQDAKDRKSILSSKRKTPADIWLSYLAVTFDIYFDCTLEIIYKEAWVQKITDRICYTNPDTHKKMNEIQQLLQDYMRERING